MDDRPRKVRIGLYGQSLPQLTPQQRFQRWASSVATQQRQMRQEDAWRTRHWRDGLNSRIYDAEEDLMQIIQDQDEQRSRPYINELLRLQLQSRTYDALAFRHRYATRMSENNQQLFSALILPHVPGFRHLPGQRGYQEAHDEFYRTALIHEYM